MKGIGLCRSSAQTGFMKQDNIKELIKSCTDKKENYFAIAHKNHEVLIGIYRNGDFLFYQNRELEPEFLLELRIFNDLFELHILKMNDDEFLYRVRTDETGEEVEVYDEEHAVFGTSIEDLGNGWKALRESRGTCIQVPFNLSESDGKAPLLYYRVRNYIGYDKDDHIHFYDARLCGFLDKNLRAVEGVI